MKISSRSGDAKQGQKRTEGLSVKSFMPRSRKLWSWAKVVGHTFKPRHKTRFQHLRPTPSYFAPVRHKNTLAGGRPPSQRPARTGLWVVFSKIQKNIPRRRSTQRTMQHRHTREKAEPLRARWPRLTNRKRSCHSKLLKKTRVCPISSLSRVWETYIPLIYV